MVQITIPELPLAYLAAAAVIGLLAFLAKRNQKQGWRRQRTSWYEAHVEAAAGAFPAPAQAASDKTLHHFGDLSRLRQALTAEGEPTRPEAAREPVPEAVSKGR